MLQRRTDGLERNLRHDRDANLARSLRLKRQGHYYEQLANLARLAVDLTDPQDLLQRAPAMMAKALGCEAAQVYLVEASRLELRVVSAFGRPSGPFLGQRLPNQPNMAPGYAVDRRDAVLIQDCASEGRFAMPFDGQRDGLKSGLAVPIFDHGQVIGVLAADSTQVSHFAHEEVRFMQAVADVVGTSLQRAQMESQLRQADKMECVGQLTGGIAHDFNNLLTVIQGCLQMAQEYLQDRGDDPGLEMVQTASGAAKRASELTGKLLALSRRQMLNPRRVSLGELLPSLLDLLRRTLGKEIYVVAEIAPQCPPCLVDRVQLESALLNIAINARDAMPLGGTLRFICGECQAPAVELSGRGAVRTSALPMAWVSLSIIDTGLGMTAAVRERAFEPFFTTKEAGRGTGLGLSSVYGFVRQSMGCITIDSALGVGTTVTMKLPALKDQVVAGGAQSRRDRVPTTGVQVMLVDDDFEMGNLTQYLLESIGCVVSTYESSEVAWAALRDGAVAELLMVDIDQGPGENATEFARRAKSLRPNLPVMLTSGQSKYMRDMRREEPGRWPLLIKPFSQDELAAAVSLALNDGFVRTQPSRNEI